MKLTQCVLGLMVVCTTSAAAQVDTVARMDSLFARLGKDGPGCAVGVARAGAPEILRTYGMASLEYRVPIDSGTVFHAASIAKQFTAAAIVRLEMQGKLRLDDDVRRWVHELPDYGQPITLRHLMAHTSGLRNSGDLLWLAGGRDDGTTEEDVLAAIFRQRSLNFPPGTQHLYSNSGYTLLALVVRRASGTPLKEYAARELFGPLGLTRTQFVDSRYAVIPGRATGYRGLTGGIWGHAAYLQDTYGAGGIFTTTGDLLRWYQQLHSGTELARTLLALATERARLTSGDSVPYSMGLELGSYRRVPFIAHGGNAAGENAYAMHFPDRRLSIVVLCNGREIDAFMLARQTAGLFIAPVAAAQVATAAARTSLTLGASRLNALAGLYYNEELLTTRLIVAREGRLFWVRGGPGTPLDAMDSSRFAFPPGTPVELYFPAAGPGSPREMHVLSGGTVTKYVRATPFVTPAGGMSQYRGRFRSEEIGVTLSVAPVDSAIEISGPGSWRFRAEPLFRDAFTISEAAVFRFVRRNGRITRMIVDMPRTRRVVFTRIQ